jgi:prepilin-type processing-associated H-X9-DG protein
LVVLMDGLLSANGLYIQQTLTATFQHDWLRNWHGGGNNVLFLDGHAAWYSAAHVQGWNQWWVPTPYP